MRTGASRNRGNTHDRPTNDNPKDPAQLSLGAIIAGLPAVRAAKKANTLSRVHRRLIEPIETEQDNEARLSFQHTVFCQTGLPYRNPGDDVRLWQREQGAVSLLIKPDALGIPTPKMGGGWFAVGNEAAPDPRAPERRGAAAEIRR